MKLCYGTTRTVILTKRYAFKIPTFSTWQNFLYGLLGNMQEKLFQSCCDPYLAPILFSIPGGWLNVMPRCDVKSMENEDRFEYIDRWIDNIKNGLVPEEMVHVLKNIVELKVDSVGMYKDRIVAVDYGSNGCIQDCKTCKYD